MINNFVTNLVMLTLEYLIMLKMFIACVVFIANSLRSKCWNICSTLGVIGVW
jgi:hypothetical protein